MSAEHTPGPWEAIGNLVRSPMHQPEGLPRGAQIADCRDGYFLTGTDEAKANARLIAAAPELLEALKSMLEQFNYSTIAGIVHDESEAIAKARAAIAKAEGGAA